MQLFHETALIFETVLGLDTNRVPVCVLCASPLKKRPNRQEKSKVRYRRRAPAGQIMPAMVEQDAPNLPQPAE